MSVRRATTEDHPRICAVLAEAFSNDPPMRWFMAASPRRGRRLERFFMAMLPRLYERHGEAWVSDEPLGAALWVAPGAQRMRPERAHERRDPGELVAHPRLRPPRPGCYPQRRAERLVADPGLAMALVQPRQHRHEEALELAARAAATRP